MNLKKNLIFIIVISIITIFCAYLVIKSDFSKDININHVKYVKIAGQVLKTELAISGKDQERGLSGRNFMKDDEGMLFIFPESSQNYFWMKEMNFPIDIIWINENLRVIYIKKEALPSSFPESFGPKEESKYVLEVNSLFSEKNNLQVGDFIEFLP